MPSPPRSLADGSGGEGGGGRAEGAESSGAGAGSGGRGGVNLRAAVAAARRVAHGGFGGGPDFIGGLATVWEEKRWIRDCSPIT